MKNTRFINNWDLVDMSSRDIVGLYIYENPENMPFLERLAKSDSVWERRIAVISTFYFIGKGNPNPSLSIIDILLSDKHDLIQKANGWTLREIGKRIDEQLLINFLRENYDNIAAHNFALRNRKVPRTDPKTVSSWKLLLVFICYV